MERITTNRLVDRLMITLLASYNAKWLKIVICRTQHVEERYAVGYASKFKAIVGADKEKKAVCTLAWKKNSKVGWNNQRRSTQTFDLECS